MKERSGILAWNKTDIWTGAAQGKKRIRHYPDGLYSILGAQKHLDDFR